MDDSKHSKDLAHGFQQADKILATLDPRTLATTLEQAADITLIIEDGIIKDIAIPDTNLQQEGFATSWPGKSWIRTVTVESRPKIEDLLSASANRNSVTERQVNHMSTSAQDVPIKYKTVQTDQPNRIIALGRNLRSLSALQQRLVRTHQDLERDYARLRATETRYRVLLDTITEPILIIDADTMSIKDVNAPAIRLVGRVRDEIISQSIRDFFRQDQSGRLERLTARAISDGNAASDPIALMDGQTVKLFASAFHQGVGPQIMVRLQAETAAQPAEKGGDAMLNALQDLPDALVVTSPDLRILTANRAFLDNVQITGAAQIRGASLGDFLGRSQTDLNVLISNLKTGGFVRNFATSLTDRFGAEDQVEVSAIETSQSGQPVFGFSIRNVARRLPSDPGISERLPSTADQLTNLVGRVPLKDIVKEATVLIERLCIEAALNLTGDNRASAAEILGLSRQGLYSKLSRFGDTDDA